MRTLLCLLLAGALATAADAPRQAEREKMIYEQLAQRGITHEPTLAALRRVPRDKFVPPESREDAYADSPLPIGWGQTISQPYMVAFMTETGALTRDSKVLEIGTGSGYQAAVAAELSDHVYSIEIIPELAELARRNLAATGYSRVHLRTGDGYNGWPEEAPFDVIIVTAAAEKIPAPLVEQLKEGGRMLIPIGPPRGVQDLMLVTKSLGRIRTQSLMSVRFVPFTRAPR